MKPATFHFGTVLCLALLLALSSVRAESLTADDEQALRSAGLSADGASLLAAVRKHTLTTETRKKVDGLIARLGADSFAEREKASKQLFALGRVTLPQLREASKHNDPEIARRAKSSIERIEQEPAHQLPAVALRLLAVRKPPGVVAALLAYLPHAEEEAQMEEVRQALTLLALRDGKADPDLVRALGDPQPLRRFTAAEALAKGGDALGRSAARKLLKDAVPIVRMRVALALAQTKERDSVPVLIDLLAELPDEPFAEVESALYQLAGDSAPQTPAGMGPAERKKCRDAWAAWWQDNAPHTDLNRLRAQPMLGYTLLCDSGKNRVYEIDRHGKQRWAINDLQLPADAWVLAGNRVLIAEYAVDRVTERDFKGNILWQKKVRRPISVQRLPNGNTFIATDQGAIREVDRAGKDIYVIQNSPPGVRVAYRLRTGAIVYLTGKGECVLVDTRGKRLKGFDTHHVPHDIGGIDLSPNGRILVTPQQDNKVVEYDVEGRKTLEVVAPQAATATGLPNSHVLVASYQSRRVYELDRAGKIVWEHKDAGHVYRARRR